MTKKSINSIYREEEAESLLIRLKDINAMKSGFKRLVVILGQLGDLDSFEYVQAISKKIPSLYHSNINLIIIGIGDEKSRKRFCSFNNLPVDLLIVDKDSTLHKKLGISPGLVSTWNPILDLLLMCIGIRSPGTLKEVLRGYTGDVNALQLFDSQDLINIGGLTSFKGSLFDRVGGGFLRPFELATLRLRNMIEILDNWKVYMNNQDLLTQRGATFLFSETNEILYSHKSTSLLGYSDTMSDPTSFIEEYLRV